MYPLRLQLLNESLSATFGGETQDPAPMYIQGRNQAGLQQQQQNLEVWMLAEAKRAAWNVMIEWCGCAINHLRSKQQT